jgi:hypothetical protein
VGVYKTGNWYQIETDTGNKGYGATVMQALRNMKETASGIIYLDTADYMILTSDTEKAVMENVSFANATLDIASMGTRSNEASYATFIGLIEDGATVSGVSFSGTMKLGPITPGKDFSLNLLANGDVTGITAGDMHLTVYGSGAFFTVNTEKLQEAIAAGSVVKENYEIALTFVSRYKDKSGNTSYVIQ